MMYVVEVLAMNAIMWVNTPGSRENLIFLKETIYIRVRLVYFLGDVWVGRLPSDVGKWCYMCVLKCLHYSSVLLSVGRSMSDFCCGDLQAQSGILIQTSVWSLIK